MGIQKFDNEAHYDTIRTAVCGPVHSCVGLEGTGGRLMISSCLTASSIFIQVSKGRCGCHDEPLTPSPTPRADMRMQSSFCLQPVVDREAFTLLTACHLLTPPRRPRADEVPSERKKKKVFDDLKSLHSVVSWEMEGQKRRDVPGHEWWTSGQDCVWQRERRRGIKIE